MKRDKDNPEYTDEVIRRWKRRRDLPFRRFDAAILALMEAVRVSALGRVFEDAWLKPLRKIADTLSRR